MSSLMNTYSRLPITFVKGQGPWLWSTEGKQYLDALSGVAVTNLGHAHPALAAALADQASQLWHTSNLYNIAHQETAGQQLCALSGMEKAFFCNSGAEANEANIKLARLYGNQRGISNGKIIVMERSFHGRTLATLSATGNTKVQAGFEPLLPDFIRVPYNDIGAVKQLADTRNDIVAILVEPVQGEGGVRVPSEDYLPQLRALCDQHQWLLMLDEVQTGIGRTGSLFAFQHTGILPDAMSLAKGLGNGMPVGACLARGKAATLFQPGNHATTFGGNPLVCRVILAVLETIRSERLLENTQHQGQALSVGLRHALQHTPGIVEVRHKGLMVGIELDRDCTALVKSALDAGILINVTAGNVVRLLPPLIISDAETQLIVERVSTLIQQFMRQQEAA
jgi:acetylornithine/N-succinyldiaminopimelate aminotransferase